ncbi:amidohydrolase family protein [Celeribacter indicus]|uniref:Amidohydrolase 2 n=1 Tax=Celeribacter indicus TaxID=1208324 RepID=A0A0B5E0I7_9RHOB|nr:amidohydrolase family protein [Celeribacter indicus]AJE49158.1 amidohydrolase 2 [Celeribacter indicus]SDX17798.1 Predicted metal-dependent hydrolase, TIM-barrel fold [Celeribacter indicus]
MDGRQDETIWGGVHAPDEDFLARARPEAPLEPDLPIVDTHLHLWRLFPDRPYLLPEHAADIAASGHNVTGSVYVECGAFYRAGGPEHLRPVGETEFAVGQAAMAASGRLTRAKVAQAIVGHVDLTLGDRVEEALAAHLEAANGRFRGVRDRAKWDADPVVKGKWSADAPHRFVDPRFAEGLRRLTRLGLSFDASIYHPQLPDVTAMARAHPEANIVLIHTASPVGHASYAGRERENLADWTRWMKELSTCPNVSVKLGGILMNLANWDFTTAERPLTSEELADLWRPYLEPCLEMFGAARCMVSSNFPVDRVGFPYGTVWNMFKRIAAGCSEEEKRLIFSGTAERVYRLAG